MKKLEESYLEDLTIDGKPYVLGDHRSKLHEDCTNTQDNNCTYHMESCYENHNQSNVFPQHNQHAQTGYYILELEPTPLKN